MYDIVSQSNDTNMFSSFNIAAAREIIYEHSWSSEGDYEVNITLENLHSEEEFGHVKYIHNFSKIVHVQYPVLNFKGQKLVLFASSWTIRC